jgi:hypothetical protein
LSQTAASQKGLAVLTLVTLGYTLPGPSTIKAAAAKNVSIYQIWALEQYINGKPTGNIAYPMYDTHGTEFAPPVGLPVNTGAFPLPQATIQN